MSIILSYPWWFLAFCILAGAGYSAGLYYRNRRQKEIPLAWVRVLMGLRFLLVTILCFFLLSPLVKNLLRTVEKPLIVIARDNSASIPINKDSTYYRTVFPGQLDAFTEKLSSKYEVFTYTFGEKLEEGVPYDFSRKQTDIHTALTEIGVRYVNRNLGAVVLATDGLYNKGMNPLYDVANLKVPIYTVAMGDSNIHRDLIVSYVDYNRVVFLGNQFPISVTVDAYKLRGSAAKLTILSEDKVVYERNLTVDNEQFSSISTAALQADKPGIRRYRIQVTRLDGEMTYINNYQDIYIEVIDSRQKILILTDAPHPDIGALQQTISANKNYQSEVVLASAFNKNIRDYSLVVMYQLPSLTNSATNLITSINQAGVPVLYVLGNSSSVNSFNQLGAGMRIIGNRSNADEVQAVYNPNFTLFTFSDEARAMLSRFPPLSSPYGNNFDVSSSASVLLFRKIGSVSTQNPLMVFSSNGKQKTGVLAGEGIFKWRLFEYNQHQNHLAFDELFTKTIQYLAVKEDKSLFRVSVDNQFFENEPVIFDAELYNESYELIKGAEIRFDIRTADGKSSYPGSTTTNRHNAGILPVGDYKYIATAQHNGKSHRKEGMFTVKPIQVEAINTVADHHLLYMLASQSGGEMVYPQQLESLYDKILAKEEIVSKSRSQKQLHDLIHYRWIFFILLLLLALEWFFRKRQGVY